MNIFLCSTVRHLLFSLLKAIKQSDKKNIIFMICDQQNIDVNNFDVSHLPKNIEVVFFKRSDLRKKVYSGVQGKLIKVLADYKVSLPTFFQKKIGKLIFNQGLSVKLTTDELSFSTVYFYNEINKISRLFRLVFKQYHLIEEGVGNYVGQPLKKHEKLVKLITRNKYKLRYLGDDKRCKSISLVNAEKAPEVLKDKVHQIDFINAEAVNNYCCDFFKISTSIQPQCILATQPFNFDDMAIYKKIIQECQNNHITVAIKPHPREDTSRYLSAFPDILIIESKIPLELVVFKANKNINVLSICSSAGLGFENYCTCLKLIEDDEYKNIKNIKILFSRWRKNINLVFPRVDKMLIELKRNLS